MENQLMEIAFRDRGHRETEASKFGDALELSCFFSVGPFDWFNKVSEEWSREALFFTMVMFRFIYIIVFSIYKTLINVYL